jgi:hypothetical protein
MVTVPEASKIIIERSRYLSEALSKDLINLSSLARYIKPEIEEMLIKKVNNGSIIMALKRLKKDLKPKTPNVKIFKIPPQMSVLTGLNLYRFDNFQTSNLKVHNFFFSQTNTETIIVAPQTSNLNIQTKNITENVAAIIISLPEDAQTTSGIHYFFLKSLAWEGINIVETFSNSKEYILIFSENDIHRAFKVLTSLFTR